jgi:hypothetical protein
MKIDTKHLPSSSIAEVVIALSIIALCFGIASILFIRSLSTTTRFQDIRKQTEIQSTIFESLIKQNDSIPFLNFEGVQTLIGTDEASDSIQIIDFITTDNRILWRQQYKP